jgi:hypothetical protein
MQWSAEVADALLVSALATEHDQRARDVRLAVRELCDAARRCQIPVSSIIVTIKRAWMRSPDVRALPPGEARALLDRLVSTCLVAFYTGVRANPEV